MVFARVVVLFSLICYQTLAHNRRPIRLVAQAYDETDKNGFNEDFVGHNELQEYRKPTFSHTYQQKFPTSSGIRAGANNQQQQLNPLLKQASTASIGALFLLLVWRSLTAYELADQFSSGITRLLAVVPTVAILCANLLGFAANFMKPLNFKKMLKFILALNIFREGVELLYNVMMLIATGSASQIPREVYFGRFFMNVWWGFLCISFSKSRWVLQPLPTTGSGTFYQKVGDDDRRQQQF